MTDEIEIKIENRVMIATINRSTKKNALNKGMYTILADAFKQVNQDESLRCLLIRADGDTFCAGNDIAYFLDDYSLAPDSPIGHFFNNLLNLNKPLIAAVQGAAVGIGLTLLLHCDLVFAAEDIRLSAPFGSLGLVPEAGSSQLLPALIGHCRTMETFLLGKVIKAQEALSYGLVNAIVPAVELNEIALAAAQKLAELPIEVLHETKRLVKKEPEILSKRIEDECRVFMKRMAREETQKNFQRFLKK
ncbi:MAG TPA: enoyl-CoA hydratase-related protein [Thermodesulfobacteriota bacterium]|nr:enoyl-CoA hydratase-related protein [Thermodesulfobacteriota bacterium]